MKIRWSFIMASLAWTVGNWFLFKSWGWNLQADLGNVLSLACLWCLGTIFLLSKIVRKDELRHGFIHGDTDRWQRMRTAFHGHGDRTS